MAESNKSKALYSSGVACLGFVAFALAAAAVALPLWGYFESTEGQLNITSLPLTQASSDLDTIQYTLSCKIFGYSQQQENVLTAYCSFC